MNIDTDVVIVGAGLSGLYTAFQLSQQGVSFQLLEARQRIGGRIHSPHHYDLGPAWFWLGHECVMDLLQQFRIDWYEQQDEGTGLYQSRSSMMQLPRGYTGQSFRVKNGLGSLSQALAQSISSDTLSLGHRVTSIVRETEHLSLVVEHERGSKTLTSQHIVLALPPRLVAQDISFSPSLSHSMRQALASTPTWMAGNAKVVVTYKTAFWRERGFSGTALSEIGPLMQIHDASLPDAKDYALFGFVNIPATARQKVSEKDMQQGVIRQFVDLFGPQAAHFESFTLFDWSKETYTAAQSDMTPLNYHPIYGLPHTSLWDDRLHFASTESDRQFGGFLEGALRSANRTVEAIIQKQKNAG